MDPPSSQSANPNDRFNTDNRTLLLQLYVRSSAAVRTQNNWFLVWFTNENLCVDSKFWMIILFFIKITLQKCLMIILFFIKITFHTSFDCAIKLLFQQKTKAVGK